MYNVTVTLKIISILKYIYIMSDNKSEPKAYVLLCILAFKSNMLKTVYY